MPRGKALGNMRRAAGLRQRDVARHVPAANGRGAIADTLLSAIETEVIRVPRGYSVLIVRAIERAKEERGDK